MDPWIKQPSFLFFQSSFGRTKFSTLEKLCASECNQKILKIRTSMHGFRNGNSIMTIIKSHLHNDILHVNLFLQHIFNRFCVFNATMQFEDHASFLEQRKCICL